ncbi:MAG: hypothetical protein WKG00_05340 [Polyangiaceae bacterium]
MSPTSAVVRLPLVALLVATGCAAPVIDEDEDLADAGEAITQGIVLVERVVSTAEPVAALTSVSAKFMRLSGASDPERVERVVGTRLDLPAALPGCLLLGEEDETSLEGLGRVTLLDAGDEVTLTAQGQAFPLDRRAFPDVGGAVFGQFYTSRDATMQLPAPAQYVLQSSGSAEMDRLTLTIDGPAAPAEVRVGDRDIAAVLQLEAGTDAPVRWRVGSDASPGDLVYVDVASSGGAVLRCAFPDGGEGVLPGGMLGTVLESSQRSSLEVSVAVHRVREAGLAEAGGLDGGEMRFDLGVVGHGSLATP